MSKLATLFQPKPVAPKLSPAKGENPQPSQVADHNISNMGGAMKFTYGNGDRPLPGYVIKRGVGIGGFGEVYFATNDAGKEVALKRIQRNLDIEIRGVRQCLNLKHPNLIGLYDIRFDDQDQGWIVMEFVSGPDLRVIIDRHPEGMTTDLILRYFGQLAAGVAYLHDHGIVHRDLKPANVFEDLGIVKIGDYGLSKFISCSRRGGQTESVGTFHYMAPEIGRGEYGKEVDIYALGIILYEMITGNVPFDGESSQEIIMKHLTADPDLTGIQPAMQFVISKAMQKNPASRFRDVRQMVEPLGLYIDESGLIQRKAIGSDPQNPAVATAAIDRTVPRVPQAAVAGNQPPMPVVASYTEPYIAQEAPFGEKPFKADRAAYAGQRAYNSKANATTLNYDEPVAKAVRQWVGSLNDWFYSPQMNGGTRALVLVIVVVLVAANIGWLGIVAFTAATIYLPYYFIWWMLKGPQPIRPYYGKPPVPPVPNYKSPNTYSADARGHAAPFVSTEERALQSRNPAPQGALGQPAPMPVHRHVPPPKKSLSQKQRRIAYRRILAQQPKTQWLAQMSGSWLGSSLVMLVTSILALVVGVGMQWNQQDSIVTFAWASIMALASTWTILALTKFWEKSEGESAPRRFTLITAGLLLGFGAFALSEYLMVPWSNMPKSEAFEEVASELPQIKWQGFYDKTGAPLLPAFVAYFAALMGIVRWWNQADPLRKRKFRVSSVVVSMLAAAACSLIVPFPQPWGALVAAGMSIALQLASPYVDLEDVPVESVEAKAVV